MTETDTIYIPLVTRLWKNVEVMGIPFEICVDASFGDAFMPVFASKEEAEKHYPDAAEILEAVMPHKGD